MALSPFGVAGNIYPLGLCPDGVLTILFFVECPPALTIEILYPGLTAEFRTPTLTAEHLAPELTANTLEPALTTRFNYPEIEAEVCPK